MFFKSTIIAFPKIKYCHICVLYFLHCLLFLTLNTIHVQTSTLTIIISNLAFHSATLRLKRDITPLSPLQINSMNIYISHNKDTTVARHFNKCPPQNPAKTDGLIISVLSFIRSPPDTKAGQTERDVEEKRWIHRLSSVVPRGLNLLD